MNIFRRWIKQTKGIGIAAVSIMLALALVASGFAPAGAAPTAEGINVGIHAVLTGPIADAGVRFTHGMVDWGRRMNEKGGINGVRINILWEDEGAAFIPRSIVLHKKFKERGVILEVGFITDQGVLLAPLLEKDEIPLLVITAYAQDMVTKPIPWNFAGVISGPDEGAAAVAWALDGWTERRPLRVGVFIYDLTRTRESVEGVKWACEQGGAELVGIEVIPIMALDTSTEWLRLAGKKPDIILVNLCAQAMIVAMKDQGRLGIQDQGISICHYASFTCLDDMKHVFLKESEGNYVTKPYPTKAELGMKEVASLKEILEAGKKYRGWDPHEVPETYVLINACMGPIIVEAIRLAIEEVGIRNLTGRAVRDAFASLRDVDTGGALPPITMSDKTPYMIDSFGICQVQQGKILPVTEKRYRGPGGFIKFE